MEDHFNKLLYLVVGVIYFFLKNEKSRNTEKQTVVDRTSGPQPVPAAEANWPNTWDHKTQEAPGGKKSLLQTSIKKVPPHPVHKTTTQQPRGKKTDRMLRRYGNWQKAIIMGEVIQPYS